MKRRTLFKLSLSALAALPFHRARLWAQPTTLSAAQLATLKDIGAVVLPSALGRAGTDAVVDNFARWVRNYRVGAEMDHGYGFTRLRSTGASPAANYPAQIFDLERAAQGRGAAFAQLDPSARRELIEAALATAQVDALPARPSGRHVAADLMGFYFHSSEASDLCYQAEIGRDACRGLPGSDEKPGTRS